MNVIYQIHLYCGHASWFMENQNNTRAVPDRNTKCLMTEDGDTLYPRKIEISGHQDAVIVTFVKKFWWWQEKKAWKYFQSLKDIPVIV